MICLPQDARYLKIPMTAILYEVIIRHETLYARRDFNVERCFDLTEQLNHAFNIIMAIKYLSVLKARNT